MRTKLRTLYEPMITYGSNPANDYSVATSKQEKNVIDFKQKVYPLAQSFPRISQTSLLQKLAIILHYILCPSCCQGTTGLTHLQPAAKTSDKHNESDEIYWH